MLCEVFPFVLEQDLERHSSFSQFSDEPVLIFLEKFIGDKSLLLTCFVKCGLYYTMFEVWDGVQSTERGMFCSSMQ